MRRSALAALTAALVLAGVAVAVARGGGPSRPVYDVAPAWSVAAPATAGTPASFCRTLGSELTHLRTGARPSDRRAVEADWSGFFHSLPLLVIASPPALRPAVRTYVALTTDFYEALLQRSFAHTGGPAHPAGGDRSLRAERSVTAVVDFAAAHCRPDPIG